MEKTDILVLGAGISGLSFAIKTAQARPDLSIMVVSKTHMRESNTSYAQGGIAAVWNHQIDSFSDHIEDTLDAGDGLCDEEIVKMVVTEGPKRVEELIGWGARFDRENGDYDLGREGGHSQNRILHFKDITGYEIQRSLNEKVKEYSNIRVVENTFAIDLLTQHHFGRHITKISPDIKCYGAYVLDKEKKSIVTILAKATVVATGGAGQVYRNTTNPKVATGDGIAMVYRAKGRIENMEFIQFHPTALYNPAGENPDFLISEAVRGFGAELKTVDGEPFMKKYDERGSLAPRDIVARAIDNELKKRGDDYVYLDCKHLPREEFLNHFPNIYEKCHSQGIDVFENMIPVVPACHYVCGGVMVNMEGQSSIHQLFAIGECTSTGLHGANRLASNSLLEGLVFGHRVSEKIINEIDNYPNTLEIPAWNAQGTTAPNELVLITQSWKELKEIMSSYVGIVRNDVRLRRALVRIDLLFRETEELYRGTVISPQLCELRNLITIGYLITRSAASRHESRGLHFTTDYPKKYGYKENTLL